MISAGNKVKQLRSTQRQQAWPLKGFQCHDLCLIRKRFSGKVARSLGVNAEQTLKLLSLRQFLRNPTLAVSHPYPNTYVEEVPLPTIQSETWLVHAKVREPHLNPPVRMNFLPFALVLPGKARKVHTNRGVQMWFANFRVNQPCFRLNCRERY